MSKRFTDSEKWKKTWFRKLPPKFKCLWVYMCDNCDIAGFWEPDFELASYFIGEHIDREETIVMFEEQFDVVGKKWLIKDYVNFQYGELKDNNNLHRSVLTKLQNSGAHEPLSSPCSGAKVKDKVKDKERGVGKTNWPHMQSESFVKTLNDYLEMRKKLRKPATDRAMEMALKTLHEHPVETAIKMLEKSIMSSWTGIFPLNDQKQATVKPANTYADRIRSIETDYNLGRIDLETKIRKINALKTETVGV